MISVAWLCVMAVGWRRGPRTLRLAAWIVAGNTALNFVLYRGRNQLIAVCALAIIAGAGLWMLHVRLTECAAPRWVRHAAVAAIALVLAVRAMRTRTLAYEEVDQLMHRDPCKEVVEHPEAAAFARRLQSQYRTGDTPCASLR